MAPQRTLPSHPPLMPALLKAPRVVPADILAGQGLALLAQGSDWAGGLWYLDADNHWRWRAARTLLGQDLSQPLDALAGEAVQTTEEDALEDLFTVVQLLATAGALGIVDRQGNLTGAVTPGSLLSALADWEIWRGLPVQWLARKAVLWLAPEMTLAEAANLFGQKGVNSGFLRKNTGEAALQITVQDLLRVYERQDSLGETKVQDLPELGTAPGWSINLEQSLNRAQDWMKGGAGAELAAINSAGELVGQIGAGELLSALQPAALLNWVGQWGQAQSALADLTRQKDFNRFIAEAASRLGNSGQANLKDEIQETLARLGQLTEVDDCAIFSADLSAGTLSMDYEWRPSELLPNLPAVQNLSLDRFPWLLSYLQQGEICYAPDIARLPPEAATDVANWSAFQLRSVLAIPLSQSASRLRFIGVSSERRTQTWSEDSIRLLQTLGQTLIGAEERLAAERRLQELNQNLAVQIRQRSEQLSESNRRFRVLANSASVLLWMSDAEENCYFFNQKWLDFRGRSLEQELEGGWEEGVHPDDLEFYLVVYRQAFARRQSYQTEYRLRRADGEYRWILEQGVPYLSPERGFLGFIGSGVDITDRKQSEEDLKQLSNRLSLALEAGAIGCWEWDLTDNAIVWDKRMFELYSVDLETESRLPYQIWAEALHPGDREATETLLWQAVQGLGEYNTQFRILQPDGAVRYIQANGAVLRDDQGQPQKMIGVNFDLTSEIETQNSLQIYRSAIEAAVDGVALLRDDKYIYLNPAHANLFGYESPAELLGQSWRRLYSEAEIARIEQEVFPILGRDRRWEGEAVATRKDGGAFDEGLSLTLMADGLLICVCRDITARKAAAKLIQHQADKEKLLRQISQRIRETLELERTFNTACAEIQSFMAVDRVAIFRFDPDSGYDDGQFVAESLAPGFSSVLAERVHDHCFGEGYAQLYQQGHYQAVADVLESNLQPCHVEILRRFQIRANLVLPLLEGQDLWGLLCIHACAGPRVWRTEEITLVQQIANQLAIAIQQAKLYDQAQQELQARQANEARLAQELQSQTLMNQVLQALRESLDLDAILATVARQALDSFQTDRVIVFRLYPDGTSRIIAEAVNDPFPALKDLHWEDETWDQEILDLYWQGQPRIVPDVMDDRWTDCLREYSQMGGIQSKMVAPILQEAPGEEAHRWLAPNSRDKLWGVLVVHACRERRVWQETEAGLLQRIADHLSIAIQQSRLFAELQERNQALAKATQSKDEFLANMSHELRTPLNAILGSAEALLDQTLGAVEPSQVRALQLIDKSGRHLLDLITDILDLAKIGAGKLELQLAPASVEKICEDSLLLVRQMAADKNIDLQSEILPNLGYLQADERRLRQVLINLLSNAIKFTPGGGQVSLSVSVDSEDNQILFAVADTGVGISPENQAKLFQPFMQIDSSLSRQYAGTGLGLNLVERLTALHGGAVSLRSALGQGSCFTVRLPYEPATNRGESSPDPPPVESPGITGALPRILLADDNEANLQTFSDYLSRKGYPLIIARNGLEAVELALAQAPDLILMDMQMPRMDGLTATATLRADPRTAQIPIIALTALALPGDEERCLSAGADAYLTKPVRFRRLTEVIQSYFSPPPSENTP
ncbi:MAG: GAF domain-containing protein [Cyanobacteria bacterium RI_101]|nr:GAF domain-containing protein [Cyanobacteria bacterium RI_101]